MRIQGRLKTGLYAAGLLTVTLFSVFIFSMGAMASDEVSKAPEKKISFARQVYNFEKLLEAENEVLSFRDAAVQASPVYSPVPAAEGEEPAWPTPDQFLTDIKNSYSARLSVIRRFSDFTQMSPEPYQAFRELCAEAERPFYDTYRTLEFADKNYQVLCRGYLNGLARQYEAAQMAQNPKTAPGEVEAAYFEGYTMRSDILLELNQYYYPEVSGLPDVDSLSGTRNMQATVENAIATDADAGMELTTAVQNALNALGFDCGAADGDAGTRTVLSICHFQRSRKLKEDGIVTEELLGRLNSLLPQPEEDEGEE